MDLEMPELNGLEALGRIMQIHPSPIIMLSSISDDGTRETIKALQYGAFDFIRKPSGPLSPDIHMRRQSSCSKKFALLRLQDGIRNRRSEH